MSFARRVTQATLGVFAPLLKQRPVQAATANPEANAEEDEANQSAPPDPARATAEAQFSGTAYQYPNPFHRPPRVSEPTSATAVPTATAPKSSPPPSPKAPTSQSPVAAPQSVGAPPPARGALIWQRTSLPASSVQRQEGNPTGGLRLVQ